MKRTLVIALISVFIVVAALILMGSPDPKWDEIRPGMQASEVVARLGSPDHDVLKSKSLQIWENAGLIRRSSLVLLYYDLRTPTLVTHAIRGEQWIWERL